MPTYASNSHRVEIIETTLPAWIASLPLWQWHEIPGSEMSDVRPDPVPYGHAAARVAAWNGATMIPGTGRYIVAAAGGHGDYIGNEVIQIDLAASTPTWEFLRGPSKTTGASTNPDYSATYTTFGDVLNNCDVYLDYRPGSTHTYSSTGYIPNGVGGKIVLPGVGGPGLSGVPAAPGDWPYEHVRECMTFDLATNDWDAPNSVVARLPVASAPWDAAACVHPGTFDLYSQRPVGTHPTSIYKWDRSENTWSIISIDQTFSAGALAIDPTRDRALYTPARPNGVSGCLGVLSVYDVSSTFTRVTGLTFGGLGEAGLTDMAGKSPALHYIDALDAFLYAGNRGDLGLEIRLIDASTYEVTAPTITADPDFDYSAAQSVKRFLSDGNTKAPARGTSIYTGESATGVHNGLQYFAALGIIAYTFQEPGNMWAMRIHTV